MIEAEVLRRAVRAALEEDLGPGDLTSRLVVPETARGRARIVAREDLVVAGLAAAEEVFRQAGAGLTFRPECADGETLSRGRTLVTVEGPARAILAGERTALNFLQRLSGIATAARRAVRAAGGRAQIADTRKTAPGLRAFDKDAVRAGGGTNHRAGLYDAVLIKDNHWRLAGGVGTAVTRARRALAAEGRPRAPVEVEVTSQAEAEEAVASGADALLLDNMDRETLARTVAAVRGRALLEVSGGVRVEEIPRLAALGVDRISMGSLTHSAPAADIALELEPL